MQKYRDLVDFLNNEYYEEIYEKCKKYYINNKEKFNLFSRKLPIPNLSYFDDIEITSLYSEDVDKCLVKVRAIVRLQIILKGRVYEGKNNYYHEERIFRYAEVTLISRLEKFFEEFKVINVIHIDEKSRFKIKDSSTKNLVPYISKENLDDYAEIFLEQMYPDMLIKPMILPVEAVLKKMGLTHCYADLEDGVFGKICFADDKKNNIKEKTIVIDKNKHFLDGFKSPRNTIIHECVHWFFHRRFFALQKLLNPDLSSIICIQIESDKHYSAIYNNDFRFMEWQANELSIRILVPTKTAKITIEELFCKYKHEKEENKLKFYEKILKEFSLIYGVSEALAKIRLLQMGYNEFTSVSEYVSSNSKTYLCNNKLILPGETYRISLSDAVIATLINPLLNEAVKAEKIAFIDGFLVINNPLYITKVNGYRTLTNYALNNIDECCLKFTVDKKYKNQETYSICYLFRKVSAKQNVRTCTLKNDEDNKKVICLSERLDDILDEDTMEVIQHMNNNFCESFNYLFEHYEMKTANYCAKLCGLSHNTINSYRDKKVTDPSLRTVLAICAGMCLKPKIAEKLLRTIGVDIFASNRQDHLIYATLIWHAYDQGLDAWNEEIIKRLGKDYTIPR